MIETIFILTLVFTIGFFLLYRKLSTVRASLLYEISLMLDNNHRQLEALSSLYIERGLAHALPQTRGFAGSPDFLRNLMNYALKNHPQTIVECSSGISTLILAHCLKRNKVGHIYSLEHDPLYANHTRTILEEHGVGEYVTVIDAPLTNLSINAWTGQWYAIDGLKEIQSIDLIVIDGPPHFSSEKARYPAVPVLFDKLSIGGAVVLDDSNRTDETWAFEQWIKDFPGSLTNLEMPKCEKGCSALIKQAKL